MKCSVCRKKVETTFLGKIVGAYFKGKPVCRDCQLMGDEHLIKKLGGKK